MLSTNQQINSSPFAGGGSGRPSLGLDDRKCATATEAARRRQYLDDAGQLPEAMAEYLDRIIEGEEQNEQR